MIYLKYRSRLFIYLVEGTDAQTLTEVVIKRSGESHRLVYIYSGFRIDMYAAWIAVDGLDLL